MDIAHVMRIKIIWIGQYLLPKLGYLYLHYLNECIGFYHELSVIEKFYNWLQSHTSTVIKPI